MQCHTLNKKNKHCPERLKSLLGSVFAEITVAGNLDILGDLETRITGLFCSRNCPGNVILPAFDHVTRLRDSGSIVISGFHSEMERECLKILLRGSQPVIICPARAIHNMRIPAEWKKPLAENRLLILSPFSESEKRVTAELAVKRNKLVVALAQELFFIYAGSGTGTYNLLSESIKNGEKIFTIKCTPNLPIIEAGAMPL